MTNYAEVSRDKMRAYHIRRHYQSLKKDRYNLRPMSLERQKLMALGYPTNIAKGV